ncbi:MAG: hypothetical protein ACI4IF_01760 [Acutalibacteraceae bacterium]
MLKKVLKYDLKAIFKYWWMGAVVTFALSLLGSVGISILNSERSVPASVNIFAVIVVVLAVLGYASFVILSLILVFSRYYKNFYSDEGYLTFTLPVKRNQLLNSKLICGILTEALTALVSLISAGTMLCIGYRDEIFTKETYDKIMEVINEIFVTNTDIVTFIVALAELVVLLLLLSLLSCLFMYVCICVGATISQKAKVACGIGIYTVASAISTFLLQMFTFFVASALSNWLYDLAEIRIYGVILLMLLTAILFIGIIIAALYALHYTLLDKKLNLN